jgi:hypothetical protein
MKQRIGLASLIVIVSMLAGGELFACGDKFLVAARGTRYQRPKNARAAAILIYANPSSERVQSFLQRQGHDAVTANSFEQLSAIISQRRFDVILATAETAARIQQLFAGVPDGAVVVDFDAAPKPAALLIAIDNAVARHDQDVRKNRTRS